MLTFEQKKAIPTDEELVKSWTEKYGEKAAQTMLKTVKENEADYEYLKQFVLKV
jgi:Asp-tRNA(Asn)/Glu-tRNA(Gln) amidotransferase B subunit